MEKGLFPGQGALSHSWGSFLGIGVLLFPLWPPSAFAGHSPGCRAPGLLSQSVLCLSLWSLGSQMPGSGWGYRIVRVLFPAVCS